MTTMKHVYLVILAAVSVNSKQASSPITPAFLKHYQEKVCLNEPTCDLTLTPNIPANKLTFDGRDCMCDYECTEYNDCCRDSPYFKAPALSDNPKTYICHPTFKIYMVANCPASYEDANVIRKCSKAFHKLDEDDSFIILPVTNKEKRITYANAYCALCNGDTDFEAWNLAAGCGELNAPITQNRYKRQARKTGVDFSKYNNKLDKILPTAHYDSSIQQFKAKYEGKDLVCNISAKQPAAFHVYTRKCLPHLIAECDAEPEGTKKCQAYTAVVYSKDTKKPYRNKECAICNGVPLEKITGCPVAVRTQGSSLFSPGTKAVGSNACSHPELAKKFC